MSGTASWGYLALVKSSSSQMVASVRLPSGALVHSVELEGCDSTGATGITVQLARRSSPGAVVTFVTPLGSTGGPATPSCGFLSVTPLPEFSPLVIDNENNTYTLLVQAPNINATVAAARVYYTLQVNPAPAVATFSDVPTSHPFFRSSRPSSPRGSRAAAAATTSARTPR